MTEPALSVKGLPLRLRCGYGVRPQSADADDPRYHRSCMRHQHHHSPVCRRGSQGCRTAHPEIEKRIRALAERAALGLPLFGDSP